MTDKQIMQKAVKLLLTIQLEEITAWDDEEAVISLADRKQKLEQMLAELED